MRIVIGRLQALPFNPSKKAMIKHGFQFIETEEIDWPDGTRDIKCKYELDLKALR